ncbi:MAG: HEAT repeat domain-containing protein, partial [Gemmatimonadales bacterium]
MRLGPILLTSHFLLAAALAAPAAAQDEAQVEAVAPILMAEDARDFQPGQFQAWLAQADPLVRRTAALAAGRIRDLRATPLLIDRLSDPDTSVQTTVMFALGLMADPASVRPIMDRLASQPAAPPEAALEGITALAKIGGGEVAQFFSGILRGTQALSVDNPADLRQRVAEELWRLGRDAPAEELLGFVRDTLIPVRTGAIFSLGRLRFPGAAQAMMFALRDEVALIRAYAARTLVPAYVDSAGLDRGTTLVELGRLVNDPDPGVRVNALRAVGAYRDSSITVEVIPHLDDNDFNVRVQAAATLGLTGGSGAIRALTGALDDRGLWAVHREALIALARVDTAAFIRRSAAWAASRDWRDRAVAANAWAVIDPAPRPGKPDFLEDPDSRVVGAALQAWSGAEPSPSAALEEAARRLSRSSDAVVRTTVADILGRARRASDIPALVTMYRRSERDSIPDAVLAALAALRGIALSDTAARLRVRTEFLDVVSRPESYLVRRWAEANWQEAAARWGPAYPIRTERTRQDYREIARRFVVSTDPSRYPHVFVEVEQRGTLELELFGPEAPLTVANFLTLVDRHYFDGLRWHRVVPNFVIQDGDPRGDGWGGPGGETRDEINRRRYNGRIVGMALSGPDTGGSQWFI